MAQIQFTSHLDTVLKATDEALARAAEIIGGLADGKNGNTCLGGDAHGFYV